MAPYTGEGLGGCSTEHAVSAVGARLAPRCSTRRPAPAPAIPTSAPPPARPFLDEVRRGRRPLRIAYTTTAPNGAPVGAESLAALAETVQLCADLGHHVEEADPEIDRAAVVPTFLTLAAANTVVNLAEPSDGGAPAAPRRGRAGHVGDGAEGRADHRGGLRARHPGRASAGPADGRVPRALRRAADAGARDACPCKLGWIDMMMEDVDEYWRRVFTFSPFTVWFNLTGQPAMMLPLGRAEGGFPVAVQLVARYGDEATLFRLGAQLERARPWFDRKPPLVS